MVKTNLEQKNCALRSLDGWILDRQVNFFKAEANKLNGSSSTRASRVSMVFLRRLFVPLELYELLL